MEFTGPPADGLTPTGQCRRFIADGPMPWASDIGSVVCGVESGSVARGSGESGIKASGSDEKQIAFTVAGETPLRN